jgi:hypothetical protein
MVKKTAPRKSPEKADPAVDPAFAPIVAAFSRDPNVTLGKALASFGLRVNGKFFAFLVRGDFVAKLPRERVAELVGAGKGKYFDRNQGKPLKEWIAVPPGGASWVELAREAHRFVKSGA